MEASNTVEVKMKKPLPLVFAGMLLVAVTALPLADTMIVKVRTTYLRKNPQFYAQNVLILSAGERLEKVSEQDGWVQVKTANGVVGWVHSSAVEVKKFNILALDKNMKTQASSSEVSLAGKGFNKQVEESYKAKHGEANFAEVDKMLLIKVDPVKVQAFLQAGKLGEYRGAK
jgi:SH3-like domain-containing protein